MAGADNAYVTIGNTTYLSAERALTGASGQIIITDNGANSTVAVSLVPSVSITTSVTTPLIIGGTAVGSSLSLQSTSGVGTTDHIKFLVGNNGATEAGRFVNSGNLGVGGVTAPTAKLHLGAGTATADTAPLAFTSGTLLAASVAGRMEFSTDDFYLTITTGAARKKIVLDDGVALTSGRVPFATTNGRLTDDADFTFATDTLTITKIAATTFTGNVTLSTINLVTDTTTGTKIGTATTQKLGFFNATPVVQPLATADLGVVLSDLGLRAVGTAYPITTSGVVTFGSLTATRVPFAGVGGLLSDDADLTFVTDTLTATKVSAPTWVLTPLIYGSSAANGDITIEGTSHATKTTSDVFLQPTGGRVAIGTTSFTKGTFLVGAVTAEMQILATADAILFSTNAFGLTAVNFGIENRATSGSLSGAGLAAYSNDGAAMALNDRLGYLTFGGSDGGGVSVRNGARIAARADGAWTTTSLPTRLTLETCPSGSTSVGIKATLLENGNFGVGVLVPAAVVEIKAGTATAGTGPLKLNSGTLLTTAVVGVEEFLTDKRYVTITTGAARKEYTLNDAALTSGRVPFATTNGRLTDDADLMFATDTLTTVNLVVSTGNVGIGTTSFGASMTQGFSIESGVAPSGNVTDAFQFYSADQAAGNAAPHFRTENGDVVKLYKTGTYTPTNVTVDRSYNADATTLDEISDVLGTLIADLQLLGVIG